MTDKTLAAANSAAALNVSATIGLRERADLFMLFDDQKFGALLQEATGAVDVKAKIAREPAPNEDRTQAQPAAAPKAERVVRDRDDACKSRDERDDSDARDAREAEAADRSTQERSDKPDHVCAKPKKAEDRAADDKTAKSGAPGEAGKSEDSADAPAAAEESAPVETVAVADAVVAEADALLLSDEASVEAEVAVVVPVAQTIVAAAVTAAVAVCETKPQIKAEAEMTAEAEVTVAPVVQTVEQAAVITAEDKKILPELQAKQAGTVETAMVEAAVTETAEIEAPQAFKAASFNKNAKIDAAASDKREPDAADGKPVKSTDNVFSLPPTAAHVATIAARQPGAAQQPGEKGATISAEARAHTVLPQAENSAKMQGYENVAQMTAAKNAKSAAANGAQVTEQVAVKLHHQAKNGIDNMTIQLRPADLGKIEIKLEFRDGAVTGVIIADQQATLDLLAKDQRSLERALQEAGLRTDSGSLSFELRDSGHDAQAQKDGGKKTSVTGDFGMGFEDSDTLEADISVIEAGRVNIRV